MDILRQLLEVAHKAQSLDFTCKNKDISRGGQILNCIFLRLLTIFQPQFRTEIKTCTKQKSVGKVLQVMHDFHILHFYAIFIQQIEKLLKI